MPRGRWELSISTILGFQRQDLEADHMATTPSPELHDLRGVRARCPKFYGVRLSSDGSHWTAAVRDFSRRERIIGESFDSERDAWTAYKKARVQYSKKDRPEDDARVEAMLKLAEQIPVVFRIEISAHGSSMDHNLPEWQAITPPLQKCRVKSDT